MKVKTVENLYGKYCIDEDTLHRPCTAITSRGGVWESNTLNFMVENMGDDSILHAGAFFGDAIPRLSSKCKGTVYTAEPCPDNFYCLERTVELNNCTNVKYFNAALGSSNEPLEMVTYLDGRKCGGTSKIEKGGDSVVQQIRIDDIVKEKVSIIHLDIEGYEENALEGAKNTIHLYKPILILETVPSTLPEGYVLLKQMEGNYIYTHE